MSTTHAVSNLKTAAGNRLNVSTGNPAIGGTSLLNNGAITDAQRG